MKQHTQQLTPLAVAVALAWSSSLFTCNAQVAVQSKDASRGLNQIEHERTRTRDAIERVSSDQAGKLDDSNTLGQSLSPEFQRAQAAAKNNPTRIQPDKARGTLKVAALDPQLPVLSKPTSQRLLRRPAPALQAENSKKPVFTPDFSRQRLTLAGLAGESIVNLPNQEVDSLADSPKTTPPTQTPPDEVMTLADLVNIGLSYSPVMEQVQAQLAAALSRTKQSRADLLPRASMRYATGPETSITTTGENNHRTSSSTMRLTQPIVNIPLIRDWMSDLDVHQAADWRMQAARESVSLAVTNATIALATARLVLNFSDEQLKEFNDLLTYVQARAAAGAASQTELERTRTRVLLARQIRIEQQAAYRNALLELERLIGQTPRALQLPYLNALPALPATQAEVRRLVRDYSYDLRALKADIEAQQNTVAAQYGKLLPVFGVSLERDDSMNVRGINPRQIDRRLLAVMTWDVSLGGKEVFAGKGAQSELASRQAKLTEETDRALQAADADFALLQSASLRVAAGDAEQKAAGAVVIATREQLRAGRLGSLLEALDAVERYFSARQRLAQTLGQQMQAQAQLLRRLGLLSTLQDNAGIALAPPPSTDATVN